MWQDSPGSCVGRGLWSGRWVLGVTAMVSSSTSTRNLSVPQVQSHNSSHQPLPRESSPCFFYFNFWHLASKARKWRIIACAYNTHILSASCRFLFLNISRSLLCPPSVSYRYSGSCQHLPGYLWPPNWPPGLWSASIKSIICQISMTVW